jgi:hypothetical protein
VRQTPLDIATRLIEDFGDRAKFMVDERVDMALQSEDPTAFQDWCLVAKAVALLTRPNGGPEVIERASGEVPSPTMAHHVANQPERRARIS